MIVCSFRLFYLPLPLKIHDMMTESPILALQQQRMLLEIEYNVDKEEHRRQMEARGLDRLAKRGDAWLNVRFGRSYYNSLNQLSVEL